MKKLKDALPLIFVVFSLFVLGYPVAFLLAYPQAKTNFEDRTRWAQRVIHALPPLKLDVSRFSFGTEADMQNGLLVKDNLPLQDNYRVQQDEVLLSKPISAIASVPLEGLKDGRNRVFHFSRLDREVFLYREGLLLTMSYEIPPEKPDGQRTEFTFVDTAGDFLLHGRLLEPEKDFTINDKTIVLRTPPSIWLELSAEPDWARPIRIIGDYAWADDTTIVFRAPPAAESEILIADSSLVWAEQLKGVTDGVNRVFSFRFGNILEEDPIRQIFIENQLLTEDSYQIIDPARSIIALSEAPAPGSRVWVNRYSTYDRPLCGMTVWECFLALPQPPMPLPHQIIERLPAFVTRYDWQSERNVVRQLLYTAQGTVISLALGTLLGVLFSVLFVFFLPLERALLPWVIASQTVPIIALVPILVLLLSNLGIPIQSSRWPTALIGAYLSFFPITIGLTKGLRSIDPLRLELMRSYGATRLQELFKLRYFSALPYLFPSLKIGATVSLLGALISETETSNAKGLGFAIVGQVQAGNVSDLWVLFLFTAAMGILAVALIGWIENALAPWIRQQ